MTSRTPPFAGFEFLIAWRYLRARRAEGGVSTMTWISLIGITLAVAALIATLAVRTGFRHEFVATIVGANPHVSVLGLERYDYTPEELALIEANPEIAEALEGRAATTRTIPDYGAIAAAVAGVAGVTHVAPVVRAEVMASAGGRNTLGQVIGIAEADLRSVPLVREPLEAAGSLADFADGVAIGDGLARRLGLQVGDTIRLISPAGAQTPGGRAARVGGYPVTYIFRVGRADIDSVRIYMPRDEAQDFFNRDAVVDAVEVAVDDPEAVERYLPAIRQAAGGGIYLWTWQDRSGAFLAALEMEDNIMFVILGTLVLIAAMNIVSGLIMLVKNKSRDIGILRTMGLSEASVLRVFFICGASIGVAGTALGVALGCVFALNVDGLVGLIDSLGGSDVGDHPSLQMVGSRLPARLEAGDIAQSMALSLGLSFVITIFPARRAARMNPVEALRYE